MSDVSAILLQSGKKLITGALTGFTAIGPVKFRVGSLAGFEPDKLDTDIRGPLVFEGLAGLIQARQTADDTVRYTLTITEKFGPFDIGNIVLFASLGDGVEKALVSVVLPFSVKKYPADPDLGTTQPFPVPGSRFIVNITIKHSIDGDAVSVVVVPPEFSSLAYFDTEMTVPPSLVNPYSQFVIHNDSRTNTPTLGSKRADGSYWGIPFWQNLRSPKYGVIDGGRTGDGHKAEQGSFAWGYFYLTPDFDLSGQLGGTGYNQDNDLGYVDIVGGSPY